MRVWESILGSTPRPAIKLLNHGKSKLETSMADCIDNVLNSDDCWPSDCLDFGLLAFTWSDDSFVWSEENTTLEEQNGTRNY